MILYKNFFLLFIVADVNNTGCMTTLINETIFKANIFCIYLNINFLTIFQLYLLTNVTQTGQVYVDTRTSYYKYVHVEDLNPKPWIFGQGQIQS